MKRGRRGVERWWWLIVRRLGGRLRDGAGGDSLEGPLCQHRGETLEGGRCLTGREATVDVAGGGGVLTF